MRIADYNPDEAIPDLAGRIIFITGGTAGLGKESILHFARHGPKHIYFTGRSAANADAVISQVNAISSDVGITFLECDFGSLDSVAAAIRTFRDAESSRLDVLICNAGIMAKPAALTKDGFEMQFGINHLANALCIKLLLPLLLRTAEQPGADVRVICLTSLGFRFHPAGGILFDQLRTDQEGGFAHSWTRYAQSKLANLLYAAELARRYPALTTASVHPGVVETELVTTLPFWKRLLVSVTNPRGMLKPAQGAYNQVWAATVVKEDIESGAYYEPVGVKGAHDNDSKDEKLAARLWEWTEQELSRWMN